MHIIILVFIVNLPKGTKEKIRNLTGKSCNVFISELVVNEIKSIEKQKTNYDLPAEQEELRKKLIDD